MSRLTNRVRIVIAIVAAFLIVPVAFAQPSKSAPASVVASANVIHAITITNTTPMSFGDFIAGSVGDVVLVPATGALATPLPAGVTTAGGSVVAGSVEFTAGRNKQFSVTAAAATLTGSVPANTITVDTVKVSAVTGGTCTLANCTATAGAGSTGSQTAMTIAVGATLHLLGTEVADAYTGTMSVVLSYP